MKNSPAISIIENIQSEGFSLQEVKAALEDGAALAALGYTDADQADIDEAHSIVSKQTKFKDITSATQLRTRINNHRLSVGNKIDVVRQYGTESRVSVEQVQTAVTYTSRFGNATKTWFI